MEAAFGGKRYASDEPPPYASYGEASSAVEPVCSATKIHPLSMTLSPGPWPAPTASSPLKENRAALHTALHSKPGTSVTVAKHECQYIAGSGEWRAACEVDSSHCMMLSTQSDLTQVLSSSFK